MAIEMWFKDDIKNILLSVNASSADTARWAETAAIAAYRRGYQAALCAVALACGIPPNQVTIQLDSERSGKLLPNV